MTTTEDGDRQQTRGTNTGTTRTTPILTRQQLFNLSPNPPPPHRALINYIPFKDSPLENRPQLLIAILATRSLRPAINHLFKRRTDLQFWLYAFDHTIDMSNRLIYGNTSEMQRQTLFECFVVNYRNEVFRQRLILFMMDYGIECILRPINICEVDTMTPPPWHPERFDQERRNQHEAQAFSDRQLEVDGLFISCIYCELPGHHHRNCPNVSERPVPPSQVTTAPNSPQVHWQAADSASEQLFPRTPHCVPSVTFTTSNNATLAVPVPPTEPRATRGRNPSPYPHAQSDNHDSDDDMDAAAPEVEDRVPIFPVCTNCGYLSTPANPDCPHTPVEHTPISPLSEAGSETAIEQPEEEEIVNESSRSSSPSI